MHDRLRCQLVHRRRRPRRVDRAPRVAGRAGGSCGAMRRSPSWGDTSLGDARAGGRARSRALCSRMPVQKCIALSCQTPMGGVACGRPSACTVVIPVELRERERRRAVVHGVAPAFGSLKRMSIVPTSAVPPLAGPRTHRSGNPLAQARDGHLVAVAAATEHGSERRGVGLRDGRLASPADISAVRAEACGPSSRASPPRLTCAHQDADGPRGGCKRSAASTSREACAPAPRAAGGSVRTPPHPGPGGDETWVVGVTRGAGS